MNAKKRRKVRNAASRMRQKAGWHELTEGQTAALHAAANAIESILWKDSPLGTDRAAELLDELPQEPTALEEEYMKMFATKHDWRLGAMEDGTDGGRCA